MKCIVRKIETLEPAKINSEDNLTSEERKALHDLKMNKNIIIKPADKGSSIVIMNVEYYRDKLVMEGHLQTNAYKKCDNNIDNKVKAKLDILIDKYSHCLTQNEKDCIKNYQWKTSQLYVLPKIHKCKSILEALKTIKEGDILTLLDPEDLKARPIIAGCATPTKPLSELLEKILKPIVETQKSFIKDDWAYLKHLPKNTTDPCTLFSCDVTSLYTSIPHDLGLKAIEYWLNKRRDLVNPRFSNNFILESLKFILENNNFLFDNTMYSQCIGAAMGQICAPPYACLTIGYLEEEKLFKTELQRHFNAEEIKKIEDDFKRYMDDGSTLLPNSVDKDIFLSCLNNLHPSIVFTLEPASIIKENGKIIQILNFLDLTIMLHEDGRIETDVHYKLTNSHNYLNFSSFHPTHCKENIPYNLAKRIIIFVTDSEKMEFRLKELQNWLLKCGYPLQLIKKKIHCARLQGPSPEPKKGDDTLPLITTHMSNFDIKPLMNTIRSTITKKKSPRLEKIFENTNLVIGYRQPPNLKRLLTRATFDTSANKDILYPKPGITTCEDTRCKLCKENYIQKCTSFKTAKGTIWEIKTPINCNSTNVLYYLVCNMCNDMTYTGKTKTKLRLRMNNHISSCKSGKGTNIFDNHVFTCGSERNSLKAPFFKIYGFMKLKSDQNLITYERYLHGMGLDTMNK